MTYLSGGRGSGKTKRAIEPFRQRDPLVFTPTHRLVKEMRARGVQAKTYHSFDGVARWSGRLKEWGRSSFPCDHLGRGLHSGPPHPGNFSRLARGSGRPGVCGGDHGQPPPIAGKMHHEWLRMVAQQPANYYEEVEVDHRAKDPFLKALKKQIRLQPLMSSVKRYERCFLVASGWKPCDLILTSRLKVRDRAQKLLFERREDFSRTPRCPSSIVRKTQGGRTSW